MDKADKLRELWENKGNKNIKYSDRPHRDLIDTKLEKRKDLYSIQNLKPISDRYENVIARFNDFAEVLEIFWGIFDKKYDNYGDSILAFIGQNLTRGWPWTDIPFHSIAAWNLIIEDSQTCNPTGLYDNEIKNGNFRKLRTKAKGGKAPIIYEHWTPISFFRDIFLIAKEESLILNKEDFLALLIRNYRVVRITAEEDILLETNGFKTNRPITAYEQVGIQIKEKELWNMLNNWN